MRNKKGIELVSKFDIGQETGHKMDPEAVAREMRRAKDLNGERLFAVEELRSSQQQIASFFSRLAAKIRQQAAGQSAEPSDIQSANDEANFEC